MRNIFLFSIILIVGLTTHINGQQFNDVLKLKNGHVISGRVEQYSLDSITLMTENGVKITLPTNEIKKFQVGGEKVSIYNFRTRKPYINTQVSMLYSQNNKGVSASLSAGYSFNEWVNFGLGSGLDNYYTKSGFDMIPVFGEWTAYLSKTNVAPYIRCRAGYNFSIEKESSGYLNPTNNPFINPTFGLRLGAGKPFVHFFVGAKFQKFRVNTIGTEVTDDFRITFRRYDMGIGITF